MKRDIVKAKDFRKGKTSPKIRRNKMPESWMQQQCVKWFRLAYPMYSKLLFAVPNGGFDKAVTRKRMVAEGLVSGVSDLILLVPNDQFHGLCIEMKMPSGKLSQHQIEWGVFAEEQGYKYVVCHSLVDFMLEIKKYFD